MSTRDHIYYWKCDNPLSHAEKRQLYFGDKYERERLEPAIRRIAAACFGSEPASVRPAGCDGNHSGYLVDYPDRPLFFRADTGSDDDDYMLAESRLMELAAAAGVPVPRVYRTDVDRSEHPFRYQLMDRVAEPALHVHFNSGALDRVAVGRQLGELLRRLHAVTIDGFGFIDTARLRRDGLLRGLKPDYPAYFETCLDRHLAYLADHDLLERRETDAIAALFSRDRALLQRDRAVLVHRDPALWNVLGTPDRVTALIDWDDAVGGDPADDLGMLGCFYDSSFMVPLLEGYAAGATLDAAFRRRIDLHTLRNLLWKTMLRHYMGYFDRDGSFFLNQAAGGSLKEFTLNKLRGLLAALQTN